MNLGVWGDLTIFAGVMELLFATCVFVYIGRLEKRTSHPLGEKVGAHKAVLAKLRKREPMSQAEVDLRPNWFLMLDHRSRTRYLAPSSPWVSSTWSAACTCCISMVATPRFARLSGASRC